MLEIIKRTENERECDLDSDDDSLEERLGNIDLDKDPEAVWKFLTDAEKEEFRRLVESDKVESIVDAWKPWWMQKECLIEEVGASSSKNVLSHPEIETVSDSLVESLRKRAPAACIVYNVVNILYAYAYAMRHFNGDVDSFFIGCVSGNRVSVQ